jgi:membrane protein DedA with SNARE-associated domain
MQPYLTGHGLWPYLAIFAWTFLEGETFVLFAAFASAQGLLSAPLLLGVAALGSFCGDQCSFWVGRSFGHRVLERRPRWRSRVDRVSAILRRHDAGFILSFRFLYGVRNVASFAIGLSGVDTVRFLALNFVAAWLWAAVFVGAGYWGGRAIHRVFGEAMPYVATGMLALLIGAALAAAAYKALRQRRSVTPAPLRD